jgi:hypothetical protein
MGLAIGWLCQGSFILCLLHGGRTVSRRWTEALDRVMLYPGGVAVGAWVALQALPVALCIAVSGIMCLLLGVSGLGSFMVTMACLMTFAAACGVGLLMPNLGIERSTQHESY